MRVPRHHGGAQDRWGLSLSTFAEAAEAAYSGAVLAWLGHRAEALPLLDAALQADPDLLLGHVLCGFALRFLARRDLTAELHQILSEAERCQRARRVSPREETLLSALRLWCHGDARAAMHALAAVSAAEPRCLISFKLHHALCFLYGEREAMRRHAERTWAQTDGALPEAGFIQGCLAFALEEAGALQPAEQAARAAVDAHAADLWAQHALLHVLTMQERHAEGLIWVRAQRKHLEAGNNFAGHIVWHHALFALAERELDEALALYDTEISCWLGRDYRDFVNCASLLHWLSAAGQDVGSRWEALADWAAQRTGDHGLAFADVHYALALFSAGRNAQAEAFLRSLRESARAHADLDAQIAARVGLPLVEAMASRFGLPSERAETQGFDPEQLGQLGGSHAQGWLLLDVSRPRGASVDMRARAFPPLGPAATK